MMKFLDTLLSATSGLFKHGLEMASEGGWSYIEAGGSFGFLGALWIMFLGVICVVGYCGFSYIQGNGWFFWDEHDDASNPASAIGTFCIVPSLFTVIGGIILGGCLALIIEVVVFILSQSPYFLGFGAFCAIMWCLRWLVSLKKAVVVHTLDKGVHTDDGTPLEKTGFERMHSEEDLRMARKIIGEHEERYGRTRETSRDWERL